SHIYNQKQKSNQFDHISIIQQSEPEHNVIVPEMYVLDLLELNPNSINNVRKIL
ncbi:27381_t:CDS:1, partial [Racocetra persica]